MTTRTLTGAWGMIVAVSLAACGAGEISNDRAAGGGGGHFGAGAGGVGMGGMGTSTGTSTSTSTSASTGTGSGGAGVDAGGGTGGTANDAGRREAGVRDVFVAERGPSDPILVHVVNGCPFELWMHAEGKGVVLAPDNVHLMPGDAQDYIAPDNWPSARITAYGSTPPANEIDKVEITIDNRIVNYNITYVDWLALPIEMRAFGTGSDCKVVGCYVPESEVLTGCPEGLLTGKRCRSAGNYCSNAANQSTPFCHALDAKIAQCAQDPKYVGCAGAQGATTPQAYGCSGFFGGTPKWCAAVNRGMIDDAESKNSSLYFKNAPYNTYAAWVHTVCPGIYAFPYDDYGNPNESGFHACSGATQLNVTFCPAG